MFIKASAERSVDPLAPVALKRASSIGRWGPVFLEKVVPCGPVEIEQDGQDIDPFEPPSTGQPGAIYPNEAKGQIDDHGIGAPIADDRNGAQTPILSATHLSCASWAAKRSMTIVLQTLKTGANLLWQPFKAVRKNFPMLFGAPMAWRAPTSADDNWQPARSLQNHRSQ